VVHFTLVIWLPAGIETLALAMASVLLMIDPAVTEPAWAGAVPSSASSASQEVR
jgi:hypothetical protein